MGTLYLVRHGQASFGADDYDCLSDLGHRQCVWLGEYFRERGVRFEQALVGSLRRQQQSLAGVLEGLGGPDVPTLAWPGLNEYDSAAVIRCVHADALPKPDTPELVRHHFRLLRDGLGRWMAGEVTPEGMVCFADFRAGVTGALDHVRTQCGGDVLLVSSGGPISTAVGHVLGVAPAATIELNLRIRNSSVTEFVYTPKRHMLVTYNGIPHLDRADRRSSITHT